jgi:Cytochrome P460
MRRLLVYLLAYGSTVVLFGCGLSPAPIPEEDRSFHEALLSVAQEYKSWARVDDGIRWAPTDCRMPPPAQPRFSSSPDTATHGQKLYSLFAKDAAAYTSITKSETSKVGQILVKESWVPQETTEVKPGPPELSKVIRTGSPQRRWDYYPYASKDGKVYKTGKLAGLFVMMKLDPETPGTDDGWVYGTVSADAKTVTAAGKVESCMKCHQAAKHDRLFGLPMP